MANRRSLLNLTKHFSPSSLTSNPTFSHNLQTLPTTTLNPPNIVRTPPKTLTPKQFPFNFSILARHLSSTYKSSDDEGDDDEGEFDDDDDDGVLKSAEEIEEEAGEIGYKVVGQIEESDRPFKPYEPVFAVVQVGPHQFKVSNGDTISTERLKYCDVNDKLILNKVLMLGSATQTIIGRPILPDASVHVVVEEHALDAKVLIFKKKRRKNYRRTRGHRQELTRLRIIDIQGIQKPEKPEPKKMKPASKKLEKVAVAA
ncbi:hypothetical protein Leryth_000009 [Lithospermum erythrorhizon]|nr:hypothetical protein Leryth_000009 [Lithospermum erythrorhizon]